MTGASYVIVIDEPVIGFHGNAMISRDVAEEQGYSIEPNCWPTLEYMKQIYSEKKLNLEFIELQKAAIGLPKIEFSVQEDGCLFLRQYDPPDKFWHPSIETMRDIWGLDIREYSLRR